VRDWLRRCRTGREDWSAGQPAGACVGGGQSEDWARLVIPSHFRESDPEIHQSISVHLHRLPRDKGRRQ
jgi:hypothetical protein